MQESVVKARYTVSKKSLVAAGELVTKGNNQLGTRANP